MQVQISTDYAIRILQYLHKHKEELPTAMTISQAIGITYPFFIKIANQLKQKGLLSAVQGRNGGYRLARPADQISVYDVFHSIEGDLRINRCLQEGQHCSRGEGAREECRLHKFFHSLQSKIVEDMTSKNISDFVV
ncbi:MAG: Rrf2 family transcriptional regulator [Oscillospiraceae bacterium]|nr:Rrf2 family transcriptional regulator [Oscillospiraceae bacterium]